MAKKKWLTKLADRISESSDTGLIKLLIISVAVPIVTVILGLLYAWIFGDTQFAFNWEHNPLDWVIAAVVVFTPAVTWLIIFKQFQQQQEYNEQSLIVQKYSMVPKISSEVTRDYHEVYLRKGAINFHFSHQFKNESSNYGFIKATVLAFVSDSKPDSDDPTYYCYRLRAHRCHQALTFKEEIPIYSRYSVSSSYQLPFAFNRMDGKKVDCNDNKFIVKAASYISNRKVEKKDTEEGKTKISMDNTYSNNIRGYSGVYYKNVDDIFRVYFVFLCAVRSENKPENVYDYIIRDVRNVSYNKLKDNEACELKDDESNKSRINSFKLQKPFKLPDFLDELLPKLNKNGKLTPIENKYKVTYKGDQS